MSKQKDMGHPATWQLAVSLGDTDGNGALNLVDLPLMLNCLTGPESGADGSCTCINLDGDSDIDLNDFAMWQQQFGM